jgi:hypothetical protein
MTSFGKSVKNSNFPFEALLSHGLSYYEWRSSNAVKLKMDTAFATSNQNKDLDSDFYLALLLILAFSGLVEYRVETPEERTESIIGRLPREGEIISSYTVERKDGVVTVSDRQEHKVDKESSEIFSQLQKQQIESIERKHYQGKTLSRLVFDGVRIVFKRKKLGTKIPKKTMNFMETFGVPPN